MKAERSCWKSLCWSCYLVLAMSAPAATPTRDYVVAVSGRTRSDAGWLKVVETLRTRHEATVLVYSNSVEELLAPLRARLPRYICFVAPPLEASRAFVAQVHCLTRNLDDDPYPDCFWGILTGYDAENALRIAQAEEPLTIRKVAAGTPIPLGLCESGIWYSELDAGRAMEKDAGGQPRELKVATDTTEALVKTLTEYQTDMFITSGHATEHDWQLGYRYPNGSFRCENGVLFGQDTQKRRFPVSSSNPKVYLAVGNCLMGHIDSTTAMALAFLNSAGVKQMLGYTVNTWYGYAGWGCLDYFLEQPGRFTLAEAFRANQTALNHRLQAFFPGLVSVSFDASGRSRPKISVGDVARNAGLTAQDGLGLLYDRDVLAFYGDPAWAARMAPTSNAWDQSLVCTNGLWIFEIKPRLGTRSFAPLDANGSQRGGRPILQFFDDRLKNIRLVSGQELDPVIADDFILVPNPGGCEPTRTYRVTFEATPAK